MFLHLNRINGLGIGNGAVDILKCSLEVGQGIINLCNEHEVVNRDNISPWLPYLDIFEGFIVVFLAIIELGQTVENIQLETDRNTVGIAEDFLVGPDSGRRVILLI